MELRELFSASSATSIFKVVFQQVRLLSTVYVRRWADVLLLAGYIGQ